MKNIILFICYLSVGAAAFAENWKAIFDDPLSAPSVSVADFKEAYSYFSKVTCWYMTVQRISKEEAQKKAYTMINGRSLGDLRRLGEALDVYDAQEKMIMELQAINEGVRHKMIVGSNVTSIAGIVSGDSSLRERIKDREKSVSGLKHDMALAEESKNKGR